jgi:hypothetical protein
LFSVVWKQAVTSLATRSSARQPQNLSKTLRLWLPAPCAPPQPSLPEMLLLPTKPAPALNPFLLLASLALPCALPPICLHAEKRLRGLSSVAVSAAASTSSSVDPSVRDLIGAPAAAAMAIAKAGVVIPLLKMLQDNMLHFGRGDDQVSVWSNVQGLYILLLLMMLTCCSWQLRELLCKKELLL